MRWPWKFNRKALVAAEKPAVARCSPGDLIAAVRSRLGHPPWTTDDFTDEERASWRAMTSAERQDVFMPAIDEKRRALRRPRPRRTEDDIA